MKRAQFTSQQKEKAVAYALAHPELPLKKVAEDMGIGYSTLDKWVRQERQNGSLNASRKLTPEQEQIAQLKKEIAHLKEVNEIIKKAHVYFVNNPSR